MKLGVGLLLLLTSATAWADYHPLPPYRVFGHAPSNGDQNAIDGLIQRFCRAWAAQDAAGVAQVHASDVEWTNAFGRILRGSKALETFLSERLFPAYSSDIGAGEMARFQPISLRYIGTDAAVLHAYTVSGRGSARSDRQRRIHFNLVLAKDQGQWVIAHQTISDIRPRRSTELTAQ